MSTDAAIITARITPDHVEARCGGRAAVEATAEAAVAKLRMHFPDLADAEVRAAVPPPRPGYRRLVVAQLAHRGRGAFETRIPGRAGYVATGTSLEESVGRAVTDFPDDFRVELDVRTDPHLEGR